MAPHAAEDDTPRDSTPPPLTRITPDDVLAAAGDAAATAGAGEGVGTAGVVSAAAGAAAGTPRKRLIASADDCSVAAAAALTFLRSSVADGVPSSAGGGTAAPCFMA